jgi:hypothetical protein
MKPRKAHAAEGADRPPDTLRRRRLLLRVVRLRYDPTFEWVSGGPPYAPRSQGNGQPPNDRGWGLWDSVTRPRPVAPVDAVSLGAQRRSDDRR